MIWLNFVIRCLLFQRKFFPVSSSESLNAWIRVYLGDNKDSQQLWGSYPLSSEFVDNVFVYTFKQFSNDLFSIQIKYSFGFKQYTIAKRNGFNDWQVIYSSRENWK